LNIIALPVHLAVAASIVILCAITDWRRRIIPNYLTYPGILWGFGLGVAPESSLSIQSSLAGFGIGFIPALLLFAMGTMGGGDVKLLAAMGALVGYPGILDVLFLSILMGAALGVSLLIWRGQFLSTLRGMRGLILAMFYPGLAKQVPAMDSEFPFAVAIALGTLWALYLPGPVLLLRV